MELSDQEMDNDIQSLQEKIDLVENLDKKTDLISKVKLETLWSNHLTVDYFRTWLKLLIQGIQW